MFYVELADGPVFCNAARGWVSFVAVNAPLAAAVVLINLLFERRRRSQPVQTQPVQI